jgi:hypothetical protein
MAEEVKVKKERAKRKTSPRYLYRGGKSRPCPHISERLKLQWQDPEYRAKQLTTLREGQRKHGSVRYGVPDGMRKSQAKWFWRQARFEATLTMKKLDKAGVLDDADEFAREALHSALSIMRMEITQKDRLAAARLVLDFTKAKPAQKSEITVNKAEEWLAQVTQQNEKADEGDAGDAEASS